MHFYQAAKIVMAIGTAFTGFGFVGSLIFGLFHMKPDEVLPGAIGVAILIALFFGPLAGALAIFGWAFQ